ncbi:MAG: YfiR/HmsC family protein [Gemmatimonadaceae bacterium]
MFVSALILTVAGTGLARGAHAQEMELPVSIQVPLFLKVIAFDRQQNQQVDVSLVVGVAYQSGFRVSATTREEVVQLLRNSRERKVRVVVIDLDKEDLAEVLQQQHVTVLYVSPVRSYSIADIAAAAAAAKAITVTGVPSYVEQGLSVGARLQSDRPKLLVNLLAARRSGADFTAELLKMVEVVP